MAATANVRRCRRRADPLLVTLIGLAVSALPVFSFPGAPAAALLPLYWSLQLVFQVSFAVSAARLSRRYRAEDQDDAAHSGRRFWRFCALAFAIMSIGNLIQLGQVVLGPMDYAALMGSTVLLASVVVGTLLLVAGLLRHPGRIGTGPERARLRLDTATVLAGAATFSVLIVRLPEGAWGVSWLVEFTITLLAQPLLFLLLLFAVLRLAFTGSGPFARRVGVVLGGAAVAQTVTQAIPASVYVGDGHPGFWAFGASLIGCGLAAVGARLQELQPASQTSTGERSERPFSGLPYAAMAATWALAVAILIDQGTTWRSWTVFTGTMLTTMLVVSRQVLAFRHIAQLLHERDDLAARLSDLAYHDGLTGLANRRAFLDTLSERLRGGAAVSVLLVDLDRFKPVNDAYGHAAGDQLLIEVAGRLRGLVRAGDTVARLGGDEFAILATGLGTQAAESFAEQVRRALRGTVPIGAARVTLSGSVGLAVGTSAKYDADGLLHAADMDMYARKSRAYADSAAR